MFVPALCPLLDERRAQPARARAFIDLAVQRLQGNSAFELSSKELAAAEANGLERPKKSIASRRT
jgi:hypothetical protein